MAGVASAGPTIAVVNGSRTYDVAGAASQENTSANKSRPPALRQNSTGSARTPLSNVAPNRKDSNSLNGRPAHNRVEELGQREGSIVRSGSEPDSLLDLYRSNPSSGNVSQLHNDNDIPENMYQPDDDDPDGWIHRDKLARIESEELQAAGINLANARKNVPRGPKRGASRSGQVEEANSWPTGKYELEDTKPHASEPLEEGNDREDRFNWDLRTPEEIASDNASQIHSNPVLRKSGSKIPVLTSSPLPIPQERIERDTPLVRKRTISNSMSPEEGIPILKTRMRKGSTGSQPMHDESGALITSPAASINTKVLPSSPTKMKPKPAQASPPGTSAGRKPSGTTRKPSNSTKPAAAPSPNQRPGTRSGEMDRPRTAVNRPEGDPPWLATMYKPDPMLPPEEQIIPTHARRAQQAQWEDQGAVPRTYDRNFSPLAIHTGNGQPKEMSPDIQSPTSPGKEAEHDSTSWPLKPIPSIQSPGGRPETGGSTNGGYSTMPRVTSPAVVRSPRMGSISSGPAHVNRAHVQRIEAPDVDEKVKDKGCGCCVVM